MKTSTLPYDAGFFEGIKEGSLASARAVIPTLLALLQPRSVADVGCGTGAWLSVVRENGIETILGIDGEYVDPKALLIPRDRFLAADVARPITVPRRFDLVLSLEVAEHVVPKNAETYVANLTALSDTIAFSAAVPNQTGSGHVNEQWPEYWRELFAAHGFILIDCLRHRFWNNRDVERWYRQNLLLYVSKARLDANPFLKKELEAAAHRPLSLIHPAMYVAPSLSALLHMVPGTLRRAIQRRWGKPS
jgi:SAM-dependent methyltransferase